MNITILGRFSTISKLGIVKLIDEYVHREIGFSTISKLGIVKQKML